MDVPTQLTSLPQWLTWRYEDDTKKPNCRWKDPESWVSYTDIQGFEKIGFVFTDKDDLCGVDLDGCINAGGFYEPWSIEILQKFWGVAYAEISPSGTGVKLWTRAKKPDWAKCQHKFQTENRQQIECYDQGRWFAVTGQAIEGYTEIGDGQEALDWLCEKYLKTEPKKVSSVPTLRFSSSRLIDRVREYVANAERPSEGGRNNAAFRLAGHLFAFVQPDGERLSESEVLEWVMTWNMSLPVPMSEIEIQAVVNSAARNGTPREDKEASVMVNDYPEVDLSRLLKQDEEPLDMTDEEFCEMMVPKSGMLRMIFDYYCDMAYRKSNVMGLAVAVSVCQTLYGRKIRSHTDMRTNDYNVVLAPTGSGKEACEATVSKLLSQAAGSHLFPSTIASGNGLAKLLHATPCGIWVCDEFGKVLQAVLDRKGNYHLKEIGNNLLKLYGKSNGIWGGSAHSDGIRNQVNQPHLVVLGLSTSSTVFASVSNENVSDGLLGRIAFWPVQDRPEPKDEVEIAEIPELLLQSVKQWSAFVPGGNLGEQNPNPVTIRMACDANARWTSHAKDIDNKMRGEPEARAAIWARVAGRSMKLALTHRASRIDGELNQQDWNLVRVESEDIEWAIKLSNFLARIACSLVQENVVDTGLMKAKSILAKAIESGPVSASELLRAYRGVSAGEFEAAATALGVSVRREKTKGRPKVFYEKPMN